MELSSPHLNTLKISSKKGYILIDPDDSSDARIIILNDSEKNHIQQNQDNLVIYGPGDFEASGILVKGQRIDSETIYTIDSNEGKVLVAQSPAIAKLTDEDDYDAVVIKVIETVDEAGLSAISTKLVVVYGDPAFIPDGIKNNKISKLNLKKVEDLGGSIVYLEKK